MNKNSPFVIDVLVEVLLKNIEVMDYKVLLYIISDFNIWVNYLVITIIFFFVKYYNDNYIL